MTRRPRSNHTPAFKAKVALTAIKGENTLAGLAEVEGGATAIELMNQNFTAQELYTLATTINDGLTKAVRLVATVEHTEIPG